MDEIDKFDLSVIVELKHRIDSSEVISLQWFLNVMSLAREFQRMSEIFRFILSELLVVSEIMPSQLRNDKLSNCFYKF